MAEIVKKRPSVNRDAERKASSQTPRPATSSVIESEVFDASRKARSIVQEAEEKAAGILAQAEQDAADLRERAKREGRAAGTLEGLQKYEASVVRLNAKYDELVGQAEGELLKLSSAVARKIIQAELTLNPKVVVGIVRKALLPMNRKRSITLRVHPEDQKILETSRADLMDVLIYQSHIVFTPDANISRGGCIVETEHGTVDARLDRQFAFLTGLVTGEESHLHELLEVAADAPLQDEVTFETPPENAHEVFEPRSLVDEDATAEEFAQENQEFREYNVEPTEVETAESYVELTDDDEDEFVAKAPVEIVYSGAPEQNLPQEAEETIVPNLIDDMESMASNLENQDDLDHLLSRLDDMLATEEK